MLCVRCMVNISHPADISPMILRFFANIISLIFNPMGYTIVVYYLLIFGREPHSENAYSIFLVCILFSNLVPIFTVLLLKKMGKISDLDASQRKQRILPLTLGIIYSASAYLILSTMAADNLIRGLMFCFMTNSVIIILITKYWKISIHAWGVAGPLAALWLAGFHYPLTAVLIMGAVNWSRVILKQHTILQVLAGSALGLLLTFAQLRLFFV